MQYDVFISYSRKDYVDEQKNVIPSNEVSKIKEALTQAGITYWFDEEGVYSGDEFARVIVKNIKASKIFVFLSTKNSNQSGWTASEIATANMLKKKIIPVRIDDSVYHDDVILYISRLSHIDYGDNPEKGRQELIRSINSCLAEEKRQAEERRLAEENRELPQAEERRQEAERRAVYEMKREEEHSCREAEEQKRREEEERKRWEEVERMAISVAYSSPPEEIEVMAIRDNNTESVNYPRGKQSSKPISFSPITYKRSFWNKLFGKTYTDPISPERIVSIFKPAVHQAVYFIYYFT